MAYIILKEKPIESFQEKVGIGIFNPRGLFALRKEIEVLGADKPRENIGFTLKESVGVCVVNKRKDPEINVVLKKEKE